MAHNLWVGSAHVALNNSFLVCLSISLTVSLLPVSVCLSVRHTFRSAVCSSVRLSVCLSVCLPNYMCILPFVYLYIFLSFYL